MASIRRILLALATGLAAILVAAHLTLTVPFAPAPRLAQALPVADPGRLRADVTSLVALGPRDVDHPDRLAAAADAIAASFGAAGVSVERQAFDYRGQQLENVVARLGPTTGPLVVVGAHYDTFGDGGKNPGADDNTSGVAGLLELARLLTDRPLPNAVELVAFTGEEPPLFASQQMGSLVYANRLLTAGRRPVAMVSLEMIGYFTEVQPWPSPLLRLLYPGRGDFVLAVGRPRDRAVASWLVGSLRHHAGFPAYAWVGPEIGGMDASDQRSFWGLDIPAVMLTDTAFIRNQHYHSPGDLPTTLDYERMAGVVEGLSAALLVGFSSD
jgi:Zn-dependent M28 family amino/carboxypeptidase